MKGLTLTSIVADAVPNFLKEPTSKSAIKGTTTTFECRIDVSQPVYQWLKDGSNITKGSISLSGLAVLLLQIDDLEFSDSGNYSCVATDKQSGETATKTATLTVQGMLHFFFKEERSTCVFNLLMRNVQDIFLETELNINQGMLTVTANLENKL